MSFKSKCEVIAKYSTPLLDAESNDWSDKDYQYNKFLYKDFLSSKATVKKDCEELLIDYNLFAMQFIKTGTIFLRSTRLPSKVNTCILPLLKKMVPNLMLVCQFKRKILSDICLTFNYGQPSLTRSPQCTGQRAGWRVCRS